MGMRTPKLYVDNDGALSVRLTNKTGANSVQGEGVKASAANALSVVATASGDELILGSFRDSGIADGSDAWVQVQGLCLDKLDATGCTQGDWIGSSGTAQRMQGRAASPGSTPLHFQEMGHALQTAAANATARVLRHAN
jgi:hypothetical protein